ncbi:transposase [Chryseobacterium sp.]|nr:transposase [Chryseobacterium sp.]
MGSLQFLSLEDAQQKLDVWKEDYNSYRPHGSLGNLTPKEFIENSQKKQISLH